MSTISTQIYASCVAPALAGDVVTVKIEQNLKDGTKDLLTVKTPNQIQAKIEGPQFQITPADIAGVYPAQGSEESADEFLPHIALTSRTLPWERHGQQVTNPVTPWLALVLFRESELAPDGTLIGWQTGTTAAVTLADVAAKDAAGYAAIKAKIAKPAAEADKTPLSVLYVSNSVWNTVRPEAADIPYLTHIRQTTVDGVDSFSSIIVCNRLPWAGIDPDKPAEMHTAFLISLEGRADLFGRASNGSLAALVVLHHWSFRPSKGGDFEQVMRAIGYRPNGGVLRFGNLPQAPAQGQTVPLSGGFDAALDQHGFFRDPLEHTAEQPFVWRGPLRPFPAPPRSDGFAVRPAPEEFADVPPEQQLDCSHATAFELGRLLALANSGILEDLRNVRTKFQIVEPPKAINKLPEALQKPDWVVNNPKWFEQPWQMNNVSVVKDNVAFVSKGVTDVTGISEQIGQWGGQVLVELGGMQNPATIPVVAIDIGTLDAGKLGAMFPEIESAAGV